jgi:hypothetical protein
MCLVDFAVISMFGLVCGAAGTLATLAAVTIRRARRITTTARQSDSAPGGWDQWFLADLEARAASAPWQSHTLRTVIDEARRQRSEPDSRLGRDGWDYEQ